MTAQPRSEALARVFAFAGLHSGLSDLDRHSRSIAFVSLELQLAKALQAEVYVHRTRAAKQPITEPTIKLNSIKLEHRAKAKAERRARVMAALKDGPKSRCDLADAIGLPESTCGDFLRNMVQDGHLETFRGTKGYFIYRVAQ